MTLLLLGGARFARQVEAGNKAVMAKAAAVQLSARALGGEWSPVVKTADVPVHISLLPDGRLLYWGRDKQVTDGYDVEKKSRVYLWDTLYSKAGEEILTERKDNTTTNLFCSGHSFLPDGKLIVSGGHAKIPPPPFPTPTPKPTPTPTPGTTPAPTPTPFTYSAAEGNGERHINIYDSRTGQWAGPSTLPQMHLGRWYPYNVTLANGETLIASGSFLNGYKTNGDPLTDPNRSPSVFGLGGAVRTLDGPGTSQANGALLPNYPYLSLMPNGNVFVAGPSRAGVSSYTIEPFYEFEGLQGRITRTFLDTAQAHWEGTSVMYAPGKVLTVSGVPLPNPSPSTAAEQIDVQSGGWIPAGTLNYARHYPTATLLPDGKVLVTGGTSCPGSNNLDCGPNGSYGGAVPTPELWDPANPQVWQPMTPTTSGIPRVYHSVALLMPDGRVLVGGGGLPAAKGETVPKKYPDTVAPNGTVVCNGTGYADYRECREFGHNDVEFFSPPYLFDAEGNKAVRPSITSVPAAVAYGQSFRVGVGNLKASELSNKVILIRLPSVTHAYNQDQRRVELSYSRITNGGTLDEDNITVTAPADGTVCPPGPYMMFILSNNGRNTPSVAKIIRVGNLSLDRDSKAFFAETYTPGDLDGVIQVKAVPGVKWTAALGPGANNGWVSFTSPVTSAGVVTGTGDGEIRFRLTANTIPNPAPARTGKILVTVDGQPNAGHEFTVQQAGKFSDITYPPSTSPTAFYQEISKIFAKGVTGGCSVGSYCPGAPVSRQEMAAFLIRALGVTSLPSPPEASKTFSDVSPGQWSYVFVENAARRELTSGYGDGRFGPTDVVNRAQMAAFIIRALGITNPASPATPSFTDVPRDQWYYPYVEEMKRRGITAGYGDGRYGPNDAVTRQQMAKFLVNAFGY